MYIRECEDVWLWYGIVTLSTELVSEFVSYMRRYPALYQRLSQQVVTHLPRSRSQPCIIDIGCGPGLLLGELARKRPESCLIGVDISSDMLFYAREQLITSNTYQSISLIRSSVERLPFDSSCASVVASRFSLPYWDDPIQAFREIARVLTDDGWLILDALDPGFTGIRLWSTLLHMRYAKASRRVIEYHRDSFDSAYSKNKIYTMLEQAGLLPAKEKTQSFRWHYEIYARKGDQL
jgi:ubiquinone/menaquinone biosynthesis C-methylase UbiE